jgi:hypothetical protein
MKRSVCLCVAILCLAGTALAEPVIDGEQIPLSLETPHPYGLTDSVEPRLAWSETVRQRGATYIQPHFARFELAEGDHVVVRSPDGAQAWRYEGLGRGNLGLDPGGFWSSRIRGEAAVVELWTRHARGGFGFSIDHFYRGLTAEEIAEANPHASRAICGSDNSEWAKCYMDSEPEIYNQARAVVRLLIPGSGCTGWLIGCEGHIMTNNHCISSQAGVNNTDYEFMAEGATCQTNCIPGSVCPGIIEATTGTLVRTNSSLDYSLIKLPGNLSDTYGYMRLRESGPVLDERIYIPQHPALWGKRIAVFSDNASDASGFCEVFSLSRPPCTGGPGDIGYYCDTQGGSSGSPVLAYDDHRVVSLHHCANCPNRGLNISDVIGSLGGDLPDCSVAQLAGTIEVDRELYSCADVIRITVVDDSIQGVGAQAVTLFSNTEPLGEGALLLETEAGVFVGSIATVDTPAVPEDGLLSLANGDTIIAEYIDEDDGQGGSDIPRLTTADTDCAPPQVSDLRVTPLTVSSVLIDWGTDETATGFVRWGLSPPGDFTAGDDTPGTSHRVQLNGLLDCSVYVYSVTSTDELGNTGTDDNGGQYYRFTTACPTPDPVPDGADGTTPLIVERLSFDGSQLRVHWDDQCVDHVANVIYGPLDQVSGYTVDGGRCAVSQPELWDAVPGGDIWFLIVGANPLGVEGSWGSSSFGERAGSVPSLQCGTQFKNTAGSCP